MYRSSSRPLALRVLSAGVLNSSPAGPPAEGASSTYRCFCLPLRPMALRWCALCILRAAATAASSGLRPDACAVTAPSASLRAERSPTAPSGRSSAFVTFTHRLTMQQLTMLQEASASASKPRACGARSLGASGADPAAAALSVSSVDLAGVRVRVRVRVGVRVRVRVRVRLQSTWRG